MSEMDPNNPPGGQSETSDNPLQGYFEWQVTTLLLARDLAEPVGRGDAEAIEARRRAAEAEVSELTLAVVPDVYKNDPSLDWPPEVMMAITRATLKRAAELAQL